MSEPAWQEGESWKVAVPDSRHWRCGHALGNTKVLGLLSLRRGSLEVQRVQHLGAMTQCQAYSYKIMGCNPCEKVLASLAELDFAWAALVRFSDSQGSGCAV